jgi:hypothetical protein
MQKKPQASLTLALSKECGLLHAPTSWTLANMAAQGKQAGGISRAEKWWFREMSQPKYYNI